MSKIVVYTAIFNNYDWLKDPIVIPENIDFICFTDNSKLKSKVWKIHVIKNHDITPSLMNRQIKLLYPYSELSDYDYSLYVDGSIMIKGNVNDFLTPYLRRKPIIMNFKHPNNDCIFTEIDHCIEKGFNKEKLELQSKEYFSQNMPRHYGLSDNKIILLDNHNAKGKEMMEMWFNEVINYSGRDQTCLSYVLFKNGMHYDFFNENIEENPFFETWSHNNAPWFITFWRRTKWFCERNKVGVSFINFINNRIKPIVLKRYLKK